MDPKWSHSVSKHVLLTGFTLCVVLVTQPTAAIDIRADPEVMVENGTTGVLRCSFKSNQVVSRDATVTWSFQSSQPDTQFSKAPYTILYFANGKAFPGPDEFKHRVLFIGDINKRDVSIQLSPVQFSDNGTYFCDVKNPPDVEGTRARTELRVVLKESKNNAVIIGAVIGAVVLLILIIVAACLVMRVLHNRHDYEGCTSLESVSSQAPQPRKKVESSLEVSRCSSPSGPLQGPVIYAQLDHSGSKNSFHKMEPVVYADIRKN
ncbi:myelin protein zero-like 1 like isoform X2 [Sphaeramia orbicularis]|uniref:myelin protein zero-like 1 like isoform X2 n=1 Tax=Sphaeramia orbicularis TaxID=375764 RepID=UPI00117ED713|nr:myelin protein zero-like protein 1 isoform X2 [Sphaeramia orbicularis]